MYRYPSGEPDLCRRSIVTADAAEGECARFNLMRLIQTRPDDSTRVLLSAAVVVAAPLRIILCTNTRYDWVSIIEIFRRFFSSIFPKTRLTSRNYNDRHSREGLIVTVTHLKRIFDPLEYNCTRIRDYFGHFQQIHEFRISSCRIAPERQRRQTLRTSRMYEFV